MNIETPQFIMWAILIITLVVLIWRILYELKQEKVFDQAYEQLSKEIDDLINSSRQSREISRTIKEENLTLKEMNLQLRKELEK